MNYQFINRINPIILDNDEKNKKNELISNILRSIKKENLDLFYTLIISIIDNDKIRFKRVFSDILKEKRLTTLLDDKDEIDTQSILKICDINDYKRILFNLTIEELININSSLQTSNGGRIKIKKVIRKY